MHIVWNIKQLCDTIQAAIDEKFDFIIVIDGRRGLGKSTLAIKSALRFPIFNMNKHILFKREDVMDALSTLQNHVIVPDEMINVTHNRDFYAEDQKKLIKMLNMYRDSGNIIFACVPNFAHLDNQFRDLVKMRIHIERRGLGVIHTPNQSAYAKDKWDMAINEKIEQRWIKRGIYKPNYKRLTTYRGLIHFNKLTDIQQENYDQIKYEKRNQMYKVEGDPTENPYDRIFKLLQNKLVKRDDLQSIALSLGVDKSSITNSLRRRAAKEGVQYNSLFADDDKKINIINHSDKLDENLRAKVGAVTKWA